MERGYGGFPSPSDIVVRLLRRFFPKLQQRLSRTVTIPNTATYTSHGGNTVHVPYFSFDARIGRNSRFHGLTRENVEEIGGVEYRALNALLWIVAAVRYLFHFPSSLTDEIYNTVPFWYPVDLVYCNRSIHLHIEVAQGLRTSSIVSLCSPALVRASCNDYL